MSSAISAVASAAILVPGTRGRVAGEGGSSRDPRAVRQHFAVAEKVGQLQHSLGRLQQLADDSSVPASAALARSRSALGLSTSDSAAAISSVSALSGIATGDFEVNGIPLSVDTSSDSLSDVFARINAATNHVNASLSGDGSFVSVVGTTTGTSVLLDDGTSRLFGGLYIRAGRHQPQAESDRRHDSGRVLDLLDEVRLQLDDLFDPGADFRRADSLDRVRAELRSAIAAAFEEVLPDTTTAALRSGYGLDFEFGDSEGRVLKLDEDAFATALAADPRDVTRFLFRDATPEAGAGLVPGLLARLGELTAPDAPLATGQLVRLAA